ncbi:DUF4389 domain-containing protein [Diaminobutyricimonas sp. TR449]|uniref:DUF4389 domain-containing protein n=1 Tax=Diaminobutyricimonas sp. TR449 TaxID=2708076 RepID=UPI001FBA589F|nr:DUF4389 domain-containing protein [Diaminobutyricimonas sp. TR449]
MIGILLTITGLGLLTGGIAATVIGARQGAADGYFTTRTETLTAGSYALTSPRLGFTADREAPRLPFDVARVRVAVESTTGDDVFIGLARRADVERYLQDVAHTEVTDIQTNPFRVDYREVPGADTPEEPDAQTFWEESASGAGEQEIAWSVEPGDWELVIMNADAARGVSVDVQAGIRSDLLVPIGAGIVISGIIALVLGIPLLVLGAIGIGRRVGRRPQPPGGPPVAGPPAPGLSSGVGVPPAAGMPPAAGGPPAAGMPPATGGPPAAGGPPLATVADEDRPYPARLTGYLDPALSRWLWLVKWLLAIPHFILLFGLWIAFFITTIIAGFAILFTGRYPRSLFNFNVGVLRWNWRVTFYAYSALATDRYPPFTLSPTDYPADFDVDYPERLSHGLVLVKWWLLAIPHYVIVAALVNTAGYWGGWGWWSGDNRWPDAAGRVGGISLLTALVLIAAVILLFSGRYRARLFEFIMGINRWVYRTIVYASLMRDDYPPFRMDLGSTEPGVRPGALQPSEPRL